MFEVLFDLIVLGGFCYRWYLMEKEQQGAERR